MVRGKPYAVPAHRKPFLGHDFKFYRWQDVIEVKGDVVAIAIHNRKTKYKYVYFYADMVHSWDEAIDLVERIYRHQTDAPEKYVRDMALSVVSYLYRKGFFKK